MKYQIEKDKMQGIPETMLQTLYARAQESEKPDRHIYKVGISTRWRRSVRSI